jgi:REP element-mobilizing transposase RayT
MPQQPVSRLKLKELYVPQSPKGLAAFTTRSGVSIRQGAYLPHWTKPDGIYFVTFRLADSLPEPVLAKLKAQRDDAELAVPQRGHARTREENAAAQKMLADKVEEFLDRGAGACWMARPQAAQAVADALKHFDAQRYRLHAWCVMPNHVHVVVQPLAPHDLSKILHAWKSFTAKRINEIVGRGGVLWQAEPYDHLIRDKDDLEHCKTYTVQNPAKAGLKDWPWSGQKP